MSDVIKEVVRHDNATIVRLCGEIDLHQSPELHSTLAEYCAEKPPRMLINLSEVTYIDSSGIGSLVDIYRQLKKVNSKLILVAPSERVRSLLEITRLDQFFTVSATEDEASYL
jgi:anti-sigma B factor antagonist